MNGLDGLMIEHGMAWHGMAWHVFVRHGMAWHSHGISWHGLLDMAWHPCRVASRYQAMPCICTHVTCFAKLVCTRP